MDYSSALNETRTDTEQSETPADFRVSYESDEWGDLEPSRHEGKRIPYWEHQCQPNEEYQGFLDCMSVDEARALFEEMFKRFHVFDFGGFPLPPSGLPGFVASGYSEEDAPAKLIEIGIRYAMAIVKNERRAMHLRWQDAEALIRKIETTAEDGVYREQARQAMDECDRRDSTPQLVYFIGSQSGPIKIGIAVRPRDRLSTLQTGHHEKLELLATCDGGAKLERDYHKRFKAHRLNGEWFERCPEIEAEIERLAQKGQSHG